MNILFTVTNLEIGGAQMFVLRLANAFAESIKKDVYIYDHNPEYRQAGILNDLSPRVKILSYTNNRYWVYLTWKLNALFLKIGFKTSFRDWLNRRAFRKAIVKYKIDLVNGHMRVADQVAAEELRNRSVKFISTMHGEYEMWKNVEEKKMKETVHKVLSRANGVIYTAEKNYFAIKEELKNYLIPTKKIHIGFPDTLKNIMPVTKKQIGIPENAFVIGMVARGIPVKGWKEMIDSFLKIKIKYQHKPIYLLLIGNGDYLKNLVDKYADNNICLLQFQKNPLEYISFIKLFDIGLLPSYFPGESVPNVVIEYLYFGKPVIATAIGEIPEMIRINDKIAGAIIPYNIDGVDVEMITVAISEFIENPNQYHTISQYAKEAFEKFKIENCVNEYSLFFNEVIKCHQE